MFWAMVIGYQGGGGGRVCPCQEWSYGTRVRVFSSNNAWGEGFSVATMHGGSGWGSVAKTGWCICTMQFKINYVYSECTIALQGLHYLFINRWIAPGPFPYVLLAGKSIGRGYSPGFTWIYIPMRLTPEIGTPKMLKLPTIPGLWGYDRSIMDLS